MKKSSGIASLIVGTALTAIVTARKSSSASPTTPVQPTPAPSNYPPSTFPPSSAPWPAAPPGGWPEPPLPANVPPPAGPSFTFVALHRYEIVADVLPAKGVGLSSMADKALEQLRFTRAKLKTYKTVKRPEVGSVTRVTFLASAIASIPWAIDRPYTVPDIGTIWLVSAKEVSQ